MELVEGDGGVGQAPGDAFDEGRAHVDADFVDRLGVTAMRGEIVGERGDVLASLPSVANSTRARSISTNSVM